MDDVASARTENANLRKIQQKLLQWDNSLASLTSNQLEALELLSSDGGLISAGANPTDDEITAAVATVEPPAPTIPNSDSYAQLSTFPAGIESTRVFLNWYNGLDTEMYDQLDDVYHDYHAQLSTRSADCDALLEQIDGALRSLAALQSEYTFVADRTSSLNQASEQLIAEQQQLNGIGDEIKRRLDHFTQSELLLQRLHSPTLSVASEIFVETLNRIDECLAYLHANPKYKEAATYVVKYRLCLCKAMQIMKTYVTNAFQAATQQVTDSKLASVADDTTSNTAFAIYYGKFQSCAPRVKRIMVLIEERLDRSVEYEILLTDLHQAFLTQRANIMCGEVDIAVRNLTTTCRGDHCTLVRSACAFMVHVCQDEHRLFFNFFTHASEQLGAYLDGLCTILYDTLRPFIIHINHLETLAEICQILRVEMLDEYVQNNPDPLEAFGKTANQLLQDVQERLVFRANLYLHSDILNYRPSAGDLAYPEKLVMMENIALSLQEPIFRRTDSQSSIASTAATMEAAEQQRARSGNSTADLHGMWYPTVRRTLVCLSRLYRCVDRPIFQGLSQEALAYCIQSVSSAAAQIAARETAIDGELFEIKHLLILREQIAPFRVDFTVKETSLDFSKVKTAAFGLLQKRKQMFAMGSNNAILEFLLDGAPSVREHLHDSRKDVDRQLKSVCEQFIRDATGHLVAPLMAFLERAAGLAANSATAAASGAAAAPSLRQQPWASPQHVSEVCQSSQRLVKAQLNGLQRSMQLYLSNRDTEFILFRPIRNNVIGSFVRLEQLLATSAYTADDLVIAGCPSADQISVLLSASVLTADVAADAAVGLSRAMRKLSTASSVGSTDGAAVAAVAADVVGGGASAVTGTISRKISMEKKVSFETPPILEDVAETKALLDHADEGAEVVEGESRPLVGDGEVKSSAGDD